MFNPGGIDGTALHGTSGPPSHCAEKVRTGRIVRVLAHYDPVHQPSVPKHEADIVNMGYVLNVIEDPVERVEVLVDAYKHARRLLVVSGLIQETVELGCVAQPGTSSFCGGGT